MSLHMYGNKHNQTGGIALKIASNRNASVRNNKYVCYSINFFSCY